MAITDLTGTTWTIGDTLTSYPMGTYSLKTYALNITTSEALPDTLGNTHDTFVQMLIGYENGNELNMAFFCADTSGYPRTVVATGNDTKTLPDTWNSHFKGTFTITGGADAQDLDLITWMEANASEVTIDLTVSYAGSTILEMSASGTKTLKTAGKYCNSDILINYTKSGGGTFTPIVGALRSDAELVETWTMDSYAVADLGLTIPAYSTANATLKTGATLATLTGDPLRYRYFITERMLTIPEYSITTLAKGREEYTMGFAQYEWLYNPSGQQQTIINPSKGYGVYSQMQAATLGREVYWTSATAVGVYTSSAYGANQAFVAPTIASNKNITIKSPQIAIRGHATYLAKTFFDAIEDIRCQYVIELWRVPLTGIDGWVFGTQMDSVLDDIKNNGGTLT